MSNEETTVESDPLKSIADAMEAAVQGTREGANHAYESVENALPIASDYLTRAVYNTCYAISYGIVLPTMLVVRSVPKNNAVVHGFVDGSRAASDMVDEIKTKKTNSEAGPASSLTSG